MRELRTMIDWIAKKIRKERNEKKYRKRISRRVIFHTKQFISPRNRRLSDGRIHN